jgi:hypothetical protein
MTLQRDDVGQIGERLLSVQLELDVAGDGHVATRQIQQRLGAGRRDALLRGRGTHGRRLGLLLRSLRMVLTLRLLVPRLQALALIRYV